VGTFLSEDESVPQSEFHGKVAKRLHVLAASPLPPRLHLTGI
jgi:hypothetical protein